MAALLSAEACAFGQEPGVTTLDVVDDSEVWVTANFKETQLKHIHPGSEVEIKVDAVPGKTFSGRVVSLSTATGSVLSLMPQSRINHRRLRDVGSMSSQRI